MPALNNNLVVSKDGNKALVELMQSRQPGDKLRLTLEGVEFEAKVVENLPAYVSFDVCYEPAEKYAVAPADDSEDESDGQEEKLAATMIGVITQKKAS